MCDVFQVRISTHKPKLLSSTVVCYDLLRVIDFKTKKLGLCRGSNTYTMLGDQSQCVIGHETYGASRNQEYSGCTALSATQIC
jgi:hypothetical protein